MRNEWLSIPGEIQISSLHTKAATVSWRRRMCVHMGALHYERAFTPEDCSLFQKTLLFGPFGMARSYAGVRTSLDVPPAAGM